MLSTLQMTPFHEDLIGKCDKVFRLDVCMSGTHIKERCDSIKLLLGIAIEKNNLSKITESPFIDDDKMVQMHINTMDNIPATFTLGDDVNTLPCKIVSSLNYMRVHRLFSPAMRESFYTSVGWPGNLTDINEDYAKYKEARRCGKPGKNSLYADTFYVQPKSYGYITAVAVRAYLYTSREHFHKTRLLLKSKAGLHIGFDENLIVEIYKLFVPQYPLIKHFIDYTEYTNYGHNVVEIPMY